MRLGDYLVHDLDDTLARERAQVLDIVPASMWGDRLPESNSIAWALVHTARHATLALQAVGADAGVPDVAAVAKGAPAGGGLQEVQQAWFEDVDPHAAAAFHDTVFARVRDYLGTVDEKALDRIPDTATALAAQGVDEGEFGWLHAQWIGKPVAFFVRWPLTTHLAHHVGETITYRNQRGLSPFR